MTSWKTLTACRLSDQEVKKRQGGVMTACGKDTEMGVTRDVECNANEQSVFIAAFNDVEKIMDSEKGRERKSYESRWTGCPAPDGMILAFADPPATCRTGTSDHTPPQPNSPLPCNYNGIVQYMAGLHTQTSNPPSSFARCVGISSTRFMARACSSAGLTTLLMRREFPFQATIRPSSDGIVVNPCS